MPEIHSKGIILPASERAANNSHSRLILPQRYTEKAQSPMQPQLLLPPEYAEKIDPLEEEMRTQFKAEADSFGITDAHKKQAYVDTKINDTYDVSNKIGISHEKLTDAMYDGKLKESKVLGPGAGEAVFINALNNANRFGYGVGVLELDMDYFKMVNDRYGHIPADDLLRMVARACRQTLKRRNDFIIRFGGEELYVVMPGLNKEELLEKAQQLAENYRKLQEPFLALNGENSVNLAEFKRLREETGLTKFPLLTELQTLSIGANYIDSQDPRFATLTNGALAKEVMEETDKAVKASKERGRDRITLFSELQDLPPVSSDFVELPRTQEQLTALLANTELMTVKAINKKLRDAVQAASLAQEIQATGKSINGPKSILEILGPFLDQLDQIEFRLKADEKPLPVTKERYGKEVDLTKQYKYSIDLDED